MTTTTTPTTRRLPSKLAFMLLLLHCQVFSTTAWMYTTTTSSSTSRRRSAWLQRQQRKPTIAQFGVRRTDPLWSSMKDETTKSKVATKDGSNQDSDDDAALSDVDARVLRDLLQSNTLGLDKQENMKKLLERGVKKDTPTVAKTTEEEAESGFSSEVMKTLSDTKLWRALKRSGQDALESLGVWVSNRVERDAKLLASLGIFAFDRALKDVQRALPAVATIIQEKTPLKMLAPTSSFTNETATSKKSIREDMTTPMDELKNIQQDLQDIFNAVDTSMDSGSTTTTSASRRSTGSPTTLRSASPSNKFSKERFQKAYQRQKETTLKQENENIAESSARLTSNLIDNVWQVKREIEIEPNEPGYKTKALRASAADTASKLLGAGRYFLESIKEPDDLKLPEKASVPKEAKESKSQSNKKDDDDDDNIVDVEVTPAKTVLDADWKVEEETKAAPVVDSSSVVVEPEPVAPTTASAIFEKAQVSSAALSETRKKQMEMQQSLQSELLRISSELEYLTQHPDETWMDPGLIANEVDSLNAASLEAIVTGMIQSQREIAGLAEDIGSTGEELIEYCQESKEIVEGLLAVAQTETKTATIRDYLEQRLIFGKDYLREEDGLPVLMKLDLLQRQWKILQDEENLEQMKLEIDELQTTDDLLDQEVVVPEMTTPQSTISTEPAILDSPMNVVDEIVEESKPVEYLYEANAEPVADDDEALERHEKEDPVTFHVYEEPEIDEVEATPVMQVMDVIPEAVVVDPTPTTTMQQSSVDSAAQELLVDDSDEPTMRVVAAEVVLDDDEEDFEDTVSNARTVEAVEEGDDEKEETGLAVQLGLRTLDVVFLVAEKTVTAVPNIVSAGKVASERLAKEQLGGMGKEGWEPIGSAKRGNKRY